MKTIILFHYYNVDVNQFGGKEQPGRKTDRNIHGILLSNTYTSPATAILPKVELCNDQEQTRQVQYGYISIYFVSSLYLYRTKGKL